MGAATVKLLVSMSAVKQYTFVRHRSTVIYPAFLTQRVAMLSPSVSVRAAAMYEDEDRPVTGVD